MDGVVIANMIFALEKRTRTKGGRNVNCSSFAAIAGVRPGEGNARTSKSRSDQQRAARFSPNSIRWSQTVKPRSLRANSVFRAVYRSLTVEMDTSESERMADVQLQPGTGPSLAPSDFSAFLQGGVGWLLRPPAVPTLQP